MIILSHPTGNEFVRCVGIALAEAGLLEEFWTCLSPRLDSWVVRLLPRQVRSELSRRSIPPLLLPFTRNRPLREMVRLACGRLGVGHLLQTVLQPFSIDSVYNDLDHLVAERLRHLGRSGGVSAVYCFEDGARDTFRVASELGIGCCYDLPIAYWETTRRLLDEEAERCSEWEPTLVSTRDSVDKLQRKTDELESADLVICPSRFVYDSIPERVRRRVPCFVIPFGSPTSVSTRSGGERRERGRLRVLFAGSMTQRKGLADVFAAMKSLDPREVELVVLGSPIAPMEFYRAAYPSFTYEPPRAHEKVLELMRSCDVLVLPSIVEGRALVQQEALSCGLPLIVTPNAGGEDLIDEGTTGFIVPIRSPEQIAEKITWFVENRRLLVDMRHASMSKAAQYSWADYGRKIVEAVLTLA